LKKKYNICELCDEKAVEEVTSPDKEIPYGIRYCKKHLKENIKLNKEMGPMMGKMLASAASYKDRPSREIADRIVQSEGIKSRRQWRDYCRAHPELSLPQKANEVYNISWEEFFAKIKSKSNLKAEPSGVVSALA
jgi:hypothetical protein